MKYYGKNLIAFLSCIVFCICAFVLFRWQINKPVFYILDFRFGKMNPIVALSLLLISSCNFFILFNFKNVKLITKISGIFLLIIASAKLFSLIFNIDLFIDKALYGGQFDLFFFRSTRQGMSSYMLINLFIFGLHYLQFFSINKKQKTIIVLLLIVAFYNSLLNLLYHIFDATELTKVFGFYPMVGHAAFCSTILAASALLQNYKYGVMKDFSSPYLGGRFARIFSPIILFVPIIFAYIKYYLTKAYNLSDEFGLVILILILIILLYTVINYLSSVLNQIHKNQTDFENNYSQQLMAEIAQRTQDLKVNESKFEAIINQYPHPILMIDLNGNWVNSNPIWDSEFCFSNIEKVNYNLFKDSVLKNLEIQLEIAKVKNGKMVLTAPFLVNNFENSESEKWYEILIYPIVDDNQKISEIILFYEDLTAIKNAELNLKNNQKKFQALIENSTDITVLINKDSEILYLSPSCERLLGFTFDELKNTNAFKLLHLDTMDETMEIFNIMLQNPAVIYPTTQRILCKNGKYIWGQGSIINLLHDPNVNAIVANYRDITGNKELEDEIIKLNKYLEVKIKMRTQELLKANNELKMFTYSVSHDLRTPLAAIDGFAALIDEFHIHELNEEVKESIGHIRTSAKRMNTLINDLLHLSKMGKVEITKNEIDINLLLNTVINDFYNSNKSRAQIYVQPLKIICKIDESLIQQVWMNLISNAVKYSAKKQDPKIEIGCNEKENEYEFFVKDNGVGFDMKKADNLFGVFQRMHSSSEFDGTGIGLALVKLIIEKHGGAIWAKSVINEGSVFYFTIPK